MKGVAERISSPNGLLDPPRPKVSTLSVDYRVDFKCLGVKNDIALAQVVVTDMASIGHVTSRLKAAAPLRHGGSWDKIGAEGKSLIILKGSAVGMFRIQ